MGWLRLQGPQAESLWDEVLPAEVRELPEDLAKIDELLSDPELLEPITELWRREDLEAGREATASGRPTIPIATYVRLMVIKQRSGWGYETLVKEVSDSLHLRRFCLIAIDARVPHESTIRKLTRRLGPKTVAELSRLVIAKASRERHFAPRAARIDSTVIEADVRYPSDAIGAPGIFRLVPTLRSIQLTSLPTMRLELRAVRSSGRKVTRSHTLATTLPSLRWIAPKLCLRRLGKEGQTRSGSLSTGARSSRRVNRPLSTGATFSRRSTRLRPTTTSIASSESLSRCGS